MSVKVTRVVAEELAAELDQSADEAFNDGLRETWNGLIDWKIAVEKCIRESQDNIVILWNDAIDAATEFGYVK